MRNHDCIQRDSINNHKTDIALLKQYNIIFDKEIDSIKSTQKTNTVLLITSLVSAMLGLMGIIGIFVQLYVEK